MTNGGPTSISAAGFCAVASALGSVVSGAGLRPPTFRSPPRTPGVDRAVRRYAGGGSCVLVRRADRPAGEVVEAMVEGVVVAAQLEDEAAARLRPRLMAAAWAALDNPVASHREAAA